MQGSPYTIAEETLGATSMQRGLGGMERTNAPKGPNMYDGGAASKVQLNTQPYNNERLQTQNILQNTGSAATQANSNAVQQVRKQQLVQDNADYKANQFMEQRKTEVLSVLGAPAIAAMGAMEPAEQQAMRSNIATGKAMSIGMNPDLAQNSIRRA